MGLYGAIKHDAALGQAYPGVAYDQDLLVYYSEIDPVLHTAVESNNYGPASSVTSTIDYNPRYFLVNGEPYSAATLPIPAGAPGQRTLLRFINMGLESHVPVLQGMHMKIIAEDGNAYAYPREQYSVMLAASKSKDALIIPATAGIYPLYDRMLDLTNYQASPGGLLSLLQVAGAVTPIGLTDTVTILRAETGTTGLSVWATSSNPTATLSVLDPATNTPVVMGAAVVDSGVLNGSYHLLNLPLATTVANVVTVSSSGGGSDATSVPFSKPLVANPDAFVTLEDTPLVVAAAGVLGNDLKGGWLQASQTRQAVITTSPTNGTLILNVDGSLTYTPKVNINGADSFTYQTTSVDTVTGAVLASSVPALVTLNITAVNDAPLSSNDTYSMLANRVLTIAAAGVLANDRDAEGSPMTAMQVSAPAHGGLAFNANGSFSYTPAANFIGADQFTYGASDGVLSGNVATVAITVNPATNTAPVAVDDFATTPKNIAVAIRVIANDTDVDNNINPAGVTITTQPSRGATVRVNAVTGVITFTPALNFLGTDVFKYRVRDSAGLRSNVATVRVNVTR